MTVEVSVEKITPKKAASMLNANHNNRRLREGVAEQYAADMRAGKWTVCTAPIAFYDDGDLADGQHRLWAIVESDFSTTFTIMRGLPRQAGLNIDTGAPRTLVDNAKISGMNDDLSNELLGVVRAFATGDRTTGRLSNSQRLDLIAKHGDEARWAIAHGTRGRNLHNVCVTAAIARAYVYEGNHERLAEFGQVLSTGYGNGEGDTAAITLRNKLIETSGVPTKAWGETFLKVQNCIYYFMRHRKLTVLKSVKDEQYPLKQK